MTTRRNFLKAGGAVIISYSIPFTASTAAVGETGYLAKPPLIPNELDSWIAVGADGRVTAYFGKMDMGQGLDVAVAQIVAEELDVAFENVEVVMGDTALTCNQGGASGSTGVQWGGMALRQAAVEARRILLERAAHALDVSVTRLTVSNGIVSVPGSSATVSYADLIGGRYFHHRLDWNNEYGNRLTLTARAKPKDPSAYRVVGRTYPQKIITEKVMGRAQFITDIRLDGMLHARVIRPADAGCTPAKVYDDALRDIPGTHVVREKDFLAVVAESEWDAIRAARDLKVEWSPPCKPFVNNDDVFDYIREATPAANGMPVNKGDIDAAFRQAHRIIEAEYEWPFQSHASMGPACAVADVRADTARLWTGSQKPHYAGSGCAAIAGLAEEQVRATWVPGPGSYGRNDAGDAAMDATLLSKLTGRPVRVQYMRHDGIAWDPKGPAAMFRGRAALDRDNRVTGYHFSGKGFSRTEVAPRENHPADSLAGQLTDWPARPVGAFQYPGESYGFENKRCDWETIAPLLDRASPLRTGHLRDPLGPETHFASESFIDEIAHQTGNDPVRFRLDYIRDPRQADVVRAVASKAGWTAHTNNNRGKGNIMSGRGISCTERNGTLVAMIAEVEVERSSGRVWAKKFTVAHDCGQIINPGTLELVIEGNIVQALSRTLLEEVHFNQDQVTSVDWLSYPILDIADAPESIDIVLINRPDRPPTGAGEPATRTVPAAIANAIFDATGVRMRRVPITPQRMKAALERA